MPPCTKALAGPLLSAWQVTLPSAAMVRIELPAAQVPVTRAWIVVVLTAMVPLAVMVPPVRPVPAVTLVTVPVPAASVPHAQPPAPLLFGTWPLVQACGSW